MIGDLDPAAPMVKRIKGQVPARKAEQCFGDKNTVDSRGASFMGARSIEAVASGDSIIKVGVVESPSDFVSVPQALVGIQS